MERNYYLLSAPQIQSATNLMWGDSVIHIEHVHELKKLVEVASNQYPFIIVNEGDKSYEFFSKTEFVSDGVTNRKWSFPSFYSPARFVFSTNHPSIEPVLRKLTSAEALEILQPYLNEVEKAAQAFVNFSKDFDAKCYSMRRQLVKEERERKIEKEINEKNSADKLNTILGEVPSSTTKSSGCYVATCVYGSYDCPEVWTLRRFRDNTLAKTVYGRTFIHIYYAVSPTLVKLCGNTRWFRRLWKGKLDNMVTRLNAEGVENTPYIDRKW